ncbi:enoyl-CoA delta isomerase 2, peroxisomal [Biomphalaria glabrata]|nr:enoyl-CoA delta isomerase 2, peroxisomal [Biomphalaria glabrata]
MSTAHLHTAIKQVNGFSLYFSHDIAIIVIDRGENRLNLEFLTTFNSLLDDVERYESCKGLITTGVGKFYGNGLDLEWLANITPEDGLEFRSILNRCIKRLLSFPLPTLAAINGHAFAGGAVFAFAHDLRTMKTERGWLSFNEVFINLHFTPFLLAMLREKLGTGRNVSQALVLGHRYTAEDAFNAGMVMAMTSPNLLITESIRVLKSFSGKNGFPRDSLSKMKENVYSEILQMSDDADFKHLSSKL